MLLNVGDTFPDFELLDHTERRRRLSAYAAAGEMDKRLGFGDGYPVIVMFGRGYFCPRDQQQMRLLVPFQEELAINFAALLYVAVQPPVVQAAFRAGLGAKWAFLSDEARRVIRQIGILDETEGEYPDVALPYTFVLRPDLTIHKIYNGWYFVGRPTVEDLRQDVRAIMQTLSYYPYEVWTTDAVKQIRIPASDWSDGAPPLGANGLPVVEGVVSAFNLQSGSGTIRVEETGEELFFNFTAIPGTGYRTITAGTRVRFEVVDNPTGKTARNIQRV